MNTHEHHEDPEKGMDEGETSPSEYDPTPERPAAVDARKEREMMQESGQETEDLVAFSWTFNRIVAVVALTLIANGAQIILYFTGGALTFIAISIGTTTQQNWLLTANTLAVTATTPFVGYLSDLLGRRWLTIFGTLCLVVSSIVMGVTTSLASAITGQAIGGIGAGICELTALAGVAEITPVKWRGITLAIVVFAIVPFMPYLIYIEQLQLVSSWRWCFVITGGWNLIALVGLIFCYKPPSRGNNKGLTKMEILRRIDWTGALLSVGGVTLFLVGINAGGYDYPWTNAKVLGPLIVGGFMLFGVFPLWEWKFARYPMVPHELFQGQRVVLLAYIIVFVAGMNFYSVLGFFPLILQYYYNTTPMEIGVRGLTYPIAFLIGATVVNLAIPYSRGHVREMMLTGAVLMTAFGGMLAAATPFNPAVALAAATLDAFGIGIIIIPSLTLALYCCPDAYIGTAAALSLCARFLGGSIGTAIFFNIFNTRLMSNIKTNVAEAIVKAGLPMANVEKLITALQTPTDPAAAAAKVPGATLKIIEAGSLAFRYAYADALRNVWYATIPFGVLCIVACLFLPNIRKFMTNRVAVDIL